MSIFSWWIVNEHINPQVCLFVQHSIFNNKKKLCMLEHVFVDTLYIDAKIRLVQRSVVEIWLQEVISSLEKT